MEQTQDISKSYIRGGIRDKKSPIHWRTLSDNFSLLGKPKKIIVLPGNAAIQNTINAIMSKKQKARL